MVMKRTAAALTLVTRAPQHPERVESFVRTSRMSRCSGLPKVPHPEVEPGSNSKALRLKERAEWGRRGDCSRLVQAKGTRETSGWNQSLPGHVLSSHKPLWCPGGARHTHVLSKCRPNGDACQEAAAPMPVFSLSRKHPPQLAFVV